MSNPSDDLNFLRDALVDAYRGASAYDLPGPVRDMIQSGLEHATSIIEWLERRIHDQPA